MASGYTDDKGKLNPLLQLGDKNYQAWTVGSADPGGPPEVVWVEPAEIAEVSNELARDNLPISAGNVRAALARRRTSYPAVKGKEPRDDGAFLRNGRLEFGAAKPEPPQAGVGGWGWLGSADPVFAGVGNAGMRGWNSVAGAAEGWTMQGALRDKLALAAALQGKAGNPEVTDAVHEAAKAGLPMPTSDQDPAAVLADLVSQGMRSDSTPTGMGSSFGFYNPKYASYTQNTQNARNHPRHLAAVKTKEDADAIVEGKAKFQGEINDQDDRRKKGVSLFMTTPKSSQWMPSGSSATGYTFPSDDRVSGDYGMSKIAEYVLSLTPEQRAAMTDQQIQAKVDEILSEEADGKFKPAAAAVGQRDVSTRYWSPTSDAMELYNKDGNGYGDVSDKYGWTGALNVMMQQLGESAPNTGATMLATTLAGLASGPAAPVVGPAAMGASTAVLSAGSGFNQAFGKWLAEQGIDLSQLSDPNSPEFAAAQANLDAIAQQNPAGFMGQIDAMIKESAQRGLAEGATAVVLNKAGDALTGRIKDALPKFMRAPRTSGSLLRPVPAMIMRPVETFRGGIYKKILLPRAINGSIDTWWEATEEGLTDIITNTVMGDDIDLKTALSSFLVGGLMGGGSSFGAGKSNIDNPLQLIQEKAAEGEPGLDQVAAEIEKNTGMPAARAKAAIQKAGEILQQFETFAKRYPPSMRGYAWAHFIKGYKGSKPDLFSYEQDTRRATIKDKQNALAALQEALDQERLMAVRPANVPVSPLIPSLQGDIDRLRQGFDYTKGEGRYYHPLDPTYGGDK
jgi:hypothetical protein